MGFVGIVGFSGSKNPKNIYSTQFKQCAQIDFLLLFHMTNFENIYSTTIPFLPKLPWFFLHIHSFKRSIGEKRKITIEFLV